jgi:hypothetical protein
MHLFLRAPEYEAKKAFEQYNAMDARNRLVAGELERRWNLDYAHKQRAGRWSLSMMPFVFE